MTSAAVDEPDAATTTGERRGAALVPFGPARVEIGLAWASIDEVTAVEGARWPVDAIAVGHYEGLLPAGPERALDQAISAPRHPRRNGHARPGRLLLRELAERGIVRGDLGRPFLLPDPRPGAEGARRLLAVAGMGQPGRFGEAELTVVARELCWSLGRLGCRHLATVLIGAGEGNLAVDQAVAAWLRGISHALTGSVENRDPTLRRVTFVERDPRRLPAIRDAVLATRARLALRNRLVVTYRGTGEGDLSRPEVRRRVARLDRAAFEAWRRRGEGTDAPQPVRVTVAMEESAYRFGALTTTASVPERTVQLDRTLVAEANDELADETDPATQQERGRFLGRLLVPEDLRPGFTTSAPLVLVVDPVTARLHWELVAVTDHPGPLPPAPTPPPSAGPATNGKGQPRTATAAAEGPGSPSDTDPHGAPFLGTSRGLTRQLRTPFAPPPQPPPPPRRLLSVLVVADPAADAPLDGAWQEGNEVADLFERFNTVWAHTENRVRVVRLVGPEQATRTTVLRHLLLHHYDVVHYAGHCHYDPAEPKGCGWIFTGGTRLSVRELSRLDRAPAFVFSNACQSGVTHDAPARVSDGLAPSFAEAFFERGVANFVGTAWPVHDDMALGFALAAYRSLLGLGDGRAGTGGGPPACMHTAMRRARSLVAAEPGGVRDWGAYQHYGDPYFRLFDPTSIDELA